MKKWRNSREYRIWRVKVIRRDKVCVICGSRSRRAAHHLNHATYFPEQRYDLDNGVCLCGKHHMLLHTKYKRSYRTKVTKRDFEHFKILMDSAKELAIKELKKG